MSTSPKHRLDAACYTSGRQERFANDAAGLKALRRWIGPGRLVARLVYEATGRYQPGSRRPSRAGRSSRSTPLRARRFAEASGTRAKTDAVDARMLARMGAQLALPPDPPAGPGTRELKALQTARAGLVGDRIALIQRADHGAPAAAQAARRPRAPPRRGAARRGRGGHRGPHRRRPARARRQEILRLHPLRRAAPVRHSRRRRCPSSARPRPRRSPPSPGSRP